MLNGRSAVNTEAHEYATVLQNNNGDMNALILHAQAWRTAVDVFSLGGRGSHPLRSRPAITHKSGDGPVNIVQVHPTSLAEWQKQIGIAILGQVGHC